MLTSFVRSSQGQRILSGVVLWLSALCFALALNLFYVPNLIFSNGVPGLAQIILTIFKDTPLANLLTAGNLYFILNIPLMILSWLYLGRRFSILTVTSIFLSTLVSNWVPIQQVTDNTLLAAIAGGVISGIGVGLLIKFGMSSGGFDIIALLIAKKTGRNVGFMSFLTNGLVIVGAGFLNSWEYALYSCIAIFIAGVVIDAIHTGEQRLTAFVICQDPNQVVRAIQERVVRGVTLLEGQGAFSQQPKQVLMVVLSRYELYDLQQAVLSVDSQAFINVVQSTMVAGNFLNRQQQADLRKESIF